METPAVVADTGFRRSLAVLGDPGALEEADGADVLHKGLEVASEPRTGNVDDGAPGP